MSCPPASADPQGDPLATIAKQKRLRSGHARNNVIVSSRTERRRIARTTGGTHHVHPADRALGARDSPLEPRRRALLAGALGHAARVRSGPGPALTAAAGSSCQPAGDKGRRWPGARDRARKGRKMIRTSALALSSVALVLAAL